jgi:hypothetical protein
VALAVKEPTYRTVGFEKGETDETFWWVGQSPAHTRRYHSTAVGDRIAAVDGGGGAG